MAIIAGVFEPGSAVTCQQGVTADIVSVLPAKTGRRVVGCEVRQIAPYGTPAKGALLRGLSLVQGTTNVIGAWELASGGVAAFGPHFGPAGVDASGGVCLDFEAGAFDLNVFYIDVT